MGVMLTDLARGEWEGDVDLGDGELAKIYVTAYDKTWYMGFFGKNRDRSSYHYDDH